MNTNNYVLFNDGSDVAYVNSTSNFRGADIGASQEIDIFFESASSQSSNGAYDKVRLHVKTNGDEVKALEAVASAMAGAAKEVCRVMADDDAKVYFSEYFDAVTSITSVNNLNATNAVLTTPTLTTPTITGYKIPVEDVTADDTLTAAESGKIFVFQDAAAVLTLPDSGAGDIIGTTFTFISNSAGSGQEVKCADTANEKMIGSVLIADTDDATTAGSYTAETGNNYSSIEFTGATEGELGSHFKLTCYDTDLWFIEGVVLQGGGSANPFAAS